MNVLMRNHVHHRMWKQTAYLFMAFFAASMSIQTQAQTDAVKSDVGLIRIGMIGLDTSHAPAFTKTINDDMNFRFRGRMKVVAAFPGGSPDLEASRSRVEGYTRELAAMGVEIVDSIDELLTKVDVVMLESVDGRPHLEQALPVFRSGKKIFIDKPLAGSLVDAYAISLVAERFQVPWFSSSSLRFSPGIIRFRNDSKLKDNVRGALTYGPCPIDPTHPDLFWYGIHGVEMLYTILGTGCVSVVRTHTEGTDVVTGKWFDGRLGTFRGIREGKSDYGGTVFLSDSIDSNLTYSGYGPLIDAIGDFFANGVVPIDPEETLELFAFMEAAQRSKALIGQPVNMKMIQAEALFKARQRVKELLDNK